MKKDGIVFVLAMSMATFGPYMIGTQAQASNTELTRAETEWMTETISPFCATMQGGKAEMPKNVLPVTREVPVIVYHHVSDKLEPSREVTPLKLFKEQMASLKKQGYNAISISLLTDYMSGAAVTLPTRPFVLTFDDGWKDNMDAARVLKQIGFGATFYVISNALNDAAYVSREDVKLLSNMGFEIGSHTHTHFVKHEAHLDNLDDCTIAREAAMSKKILERVTGKPIKSLAWPYGISSPSSIYAASKIGYTSTMNANLGAMNVPGNSPLFIKRFNMDGHCAMATFNEMMETHAKDCQ
jgi:peptidoglycan/xylan/chitin deacetylase (PgdA/CDA1 family)